MNLEQVIHQRWAASEPLASLLPVENVKTGRSLGEGVPYATIVREKNRTAFRSNAGDALDEVTLRVDVWHESYDEGREIAEAVKAAFDRSEFALSASDKVVQMRRTSDSATEDEDGMWRFALVFLVQVHLASGV